MHMRTFEEIFNEIFVKEESRLVTKETPVKSNENPLLDRYFKDLTIAHLKKKEVNESTRV